MAILCELGTKYPVTTQGQEIDVTDDTLEIFAGEVGELWYVPEDPNAEISPGEGVAFVQDFLKMKEDFPQFVLHYVKVEPKKITVQYSCAPMGAHGSGAIAVFVGLIILGLAIIAASIIHVKIDRGYIFTPTGTATVTAKDYETGLGLHGVKIYCDGNLIGTTDGSSVDTRQLVGEHIFSADTIPGYTDNPPAPVTKLIELNKNVTVTILLYPNGVTPPTTGWIDVYTTPEGAQIYINTDPVGVSPLSVELDAPGDYSVAFGDLEGYITPEPRTISVQPGYREVVGVTYQTPEGWEKYLWYALSAAAGIAAVAIIAPRIIKSLKSKSKED